jgi:hypothetical protein
MVFISLKNFSSSKLTAIISNDDRVNFSRFLDINGLPIIVDTTEYF